MKTRYEMAKLFSVERDFDGNIKVIAGNTTKTYKDLPILTVALLFGLSEYVVRSAELFEKYVKPEREAEFSARMLALVDQEAKGIKLLSSSTYNLQVGGERDNTYVSRCGDQRNRICVRPCGMQHGGGGQSRTPRHCSNEVD